MGKKCEDICIPYEWSHQRMTSAAKDRMTHYVNTSQPLSPDTSFITQWAHDQSDMLVEMEVYAWAQQHGLPLTKVDLALATVASLSAAKNQHSS